MRSSNKSRSRNKNNNRRNNNSGNVTNRVFDSAGPEGKVRGTPQQIIEKYQALAHDAQLSDDRVAAESFQQHAEHYSRLLVKVQKQQAEQQAEQQAQQAERQAEQAQRQAEQADRQRQQKQDEEQAKAQSVEQPADTQPPADLGSFETVSQDTQTEDNNLVSTPEGKRKPARKPRASTAKMMPEMPDVDTGAVE